VAIGNKLGVDKDGLNTQPSVRKARCESFSSGGSSDRDTGKRVECESQGTRPTPYEHLSISLFHKKPLVGGGGGVELR